MTTKTLYLTFKVNIESKNELSPEEIQHFINELDYEILYGEELQDKIDYLLTELVKVSDDQD
jgi:hypothetical protein